jgi:hypothetical protein
VDAQCFSVPFASQEVKRDITVVSTEKEKAILFLSLQFDARND